MVSSQTVNNQSSTHGMRKSHFSNIAATLGICQRDGQGDYIMAPLATTLNPLVWLLHMRRYYLQECAMPEDAIILSHIPEALHTQTATPSSPPYQQVCGHRQPATAPSAQSPIVPMRCTAASKWFWTNVRSRETPWKAKGVR